MTRRAAPSRWLRQRLLAALAMALLFAGGSAQGADETRCLGSVCIGQTIKQVEAPWATAEHVPAELRMWMQIYRLPTSRPVGGKIHPSLLKIFPGLSEHEYRALAATATPAIDEFFITPDTVMAFFPVAQICRYIKVTGEFVSDNGHLTRVTFTPRIRSDENVLVVSRISRLYLGAKLGRPELEPLIASLETRFPGIRSYEKTDTSPGYYYSYGEEGLWLFLHDLEQPLFGFEPYRQQWDRRLSVQSFCPHISID